MIISLLSFCIWLRMEQLLGENQSNLTKNKGPLQKVPIFTIWPLPPFGREVVQWFWHSQFSTLWSKLRKRPYFKHFGPPSHYSVHRWLEKNFGAENSFRFSDTGSARNPKGGGLALGTMQVFSWSKFLNRLSKGENYKKYDNCHNEPHHSVHTESETFLAQKTSKQVKILLATSQRAYLYRVR